MIDSVEMNLEMTEMQSYRNAFGSPYGGAFRTAVIGIGLTWFFAGASTAQLVPPPAGPIIDPPINPINPPITPINPITPVDPITPINPITPPGIVDPIVPGPVTPVTPVTPVGPGIGPGFGEQVGGFDPFSGLVQACGLGMVSTLGLCAAGLALMRGRTG